VDEGLARVSHRGSGRAGLQPRPAMPSLPFAGEEMLGPHRPTPPDGLAASEFIPFYSRR